MSRFSQAGYVYAIRDPRIRKQRGTEEKFDIIYVGVSQYPWEAVERHLTSSNNPEVYDWSVQLHIDFPNGIQILKEVVCQVWHGEPIEFPKAPKGLTRVVWDVIDFQPESVPKVAEGSEIVRSRTKKAYWIDRLRREGHPLLNGQVGRPPKSPS